MYSIEFEIVMPSSRWWSYCAYLYNLFSECKLCITNSKQKRTKEIENKRKRQAISATLQQKSKRNTKFLIVTCRTRTCAGGAHCISSATP